MSATLQENSIVKARFTKLHSVLRIPSYKRNDECIKEFKAKINDDEEGALECLEREKEEDVQGELLHLAVNNRKNDFVRKALKIFCAPSDQTDGRHGVNNAKVMLEKAVLFATLNDDSETLEEILKWGTENSVPVGWPEDQSNDQHCPIMYACLRNYTRCITVLYKYDYRIHLPDEDKETIEKVLKINDFASNDYQFYMKLWVGDRHVDQFYRLSCISLIKSKKRKASDTDPVERFLRMKAFSNPHYIATEFVENCSEGNCMEEIAFRMFDPIRKSLLLARYSKLLSHYYSQYSLEYLEISKRCEDFATSMLDHCDSMKDVKTVLEYSAISPNNVYGHVNEDTNWHLALHTHHKSFVGHHFYQNFLWEKITGNNFHWDNFFLIWKMLYFPYAILLFLCFPFVVLIDALFRKADILFVSPEMIKMREEISQNGNDEMIFLNSTDMESGLSEGLRIDDSMTGQSNLCSDSENLTRDSLETTAEATTKSEQDEHPFFSYFRVRIHRPILRIITYHLMEIFFLICLILTLIDPLDEDKTQQTGREKQIQVYDYITIVFISTQFLESIIDLGRRRWQSLSSFWQIYNIINSVILTVGGLTAWIAFSNMEDDNRSKLSGDHPVNVGSTLFAIGASLTLLKPLRWFLLNRSLGPVVVCIIKVLKDAYHIFRIFLVVFGAFSVTSYFMFKPFYLHDKEYKLHQDDLVTLKGLLGAMFWRVFDAGQPRYAAVMKINENCTKTNTNDDDEYDINCISNEFSHLMSMAMWAVYQAITVILLINILIAMMNTTYHRIWESSDTQWKYSKSFYQIQFLFPRAVLPSPFRFVYYIAKFIYFCKMKGSQTSENNRQHEKFQNYKQKLVEIVNIKVHSDYENSIQDDFTDLKQDLQNHISEKQKTSVNTLQKEINVLKESMEKPMDKFENLREEVRNLQQEIKDMKEKRRSRFEDEIQDLKNMITTLIDQKKDEKDD